MIETGGLSGALSLGTTALEVMVGGLRLKGRRFVGIYNNSDVVIYYGWVKDITTSTGFPIQPTEKVMIETNDRVKIYLIAGSSSNDVRIFEAG